MANFLHIGSKREIRHNMLKRKLKCSTDTRVISKIISTKVSHRNGIYHGNVGRLSGYRMLRQRRLFLDSFSIHSCSTSEAQMRDILLQCMLLCYLVLRQLTGNA